MTRPRLSITFALGLVTVLPGLRGQQVRVHGASGHVAVAFDAARGRTVAVGSRGETLEWDGSTWRQRPVAYLDVWGLSYHRMAYDPARQRALLVGWGSYFTSFTTRSFDGVEWRTLQPTTSPSPRAYFALAHDTARDELVLFGGFDAAAQFLADTWVFDGTDWSLQNLASSPVARVESVACYDSSRNRVVLFGGRGSPTVQLDDTWEWDGTSWIQRQTATTPSSLFDLTMTFDAARSRAVLLGSGYPPLPTREVWEYDGTDWHATAPAGEPELPPRGHLTFDPVRGESLLLTDYDDTRWARDAWSWDGTRWALISRREQPGPLTPLTGAAMASPNGRDLVVFHHDPGPTETWIWDGRSWATVTGPQPGPRWYPVTCGGPTHAYMYGGYDPNGGGDLAELWGFDGQGWTLLDDMGPIPGPASGIAFDWVRNELVLFGGVDAQGPLDETWVYDVAAGAWQQRQTASAPSPRGLAQMTYDLGRSRVVLVGGNDPAVGWLSDTWEWDGSAWTQSAPLPSGWPEDTRVAYDVQRGRIVGTTLDNGLQPTFREFDGSSWTALAVTDAPASIEEPNTIGLPYSFGLLLADQRNLFSLSIREADTAHYGNPCTASAPDLAANEWPRIGATGFAIDVVRAPGSLAALLGATGSANIAIGGCTQLVQPGQAVILLPTSASGVATAPLPLPADGAFLGVDLFFQAAASDPSAPSGFALSRGLQVTVGN